MGMHFERNKKVTPHMASAWLKKNIETNRKPKWTKVEQYARDMVAGNWQTDTGETIKFDETGQLIDGQNRLQAVVMAGVPTIFDIAHDVPCEAMPVLDTGAARTASDVMKISGVVNANHKQAASIVRWVLLWEKNRPMGKGSLNPTVTEISDRYYHTPELFDTATMRAIDCFRHRICNPSAAGVAYFLFWLIDAEEANSFFDSFISGANVPARSPILALRDRTQRAKIDRLTAREQLALMVKAWNFYRDDEPVMRLQLSRGELTNENFPQPR